MKDAYYFPHDSNASEDPKCLILIERFGLAGYGIYWVLLEKLRQQPDYKLALDLLPIYARQYQIKHETVLSIVIESGLFSADEKYFFSESLIRRMRKINKSREARSKAGKLGNKIRYSKLQDSQCDSNAIAMRQQCDSNAIASKDKESKEKESKEKERKGKESKGNIIKECHPALVPYDAIVKHWNDIVVSCPQVRDLSEVRKRKIYSRLREISKNPADWMPAIEAIFHEIEDSDFLSGRKTEWTASFDWLFTSPTNWRKVVEGNYRNRGAAVKKGLNDSDYLSMIAQKMQMLNEEGKEEVDIESEYYLQQ